MAVSWLTVEDQKAYCRNEIPTDDHPFIDEAIDAAVSALGSGCNRSFALASDTPSARVFRPNYGRRVLFIDDCVAVASVTENGSVLAGADYAVEPLNGLDASGSTVPYVSLRRFGTSWYVDENKATVSVSARWGWAAIPPLIVTAAKVLAKDVLLNRDVSLGLVAVTEAAGIAARENLTVRMAIDKFHLAKSIGGG